MRRTLAIPTLLAGLAVAGIACAAHQGHAGAPAVTLETMDGLAPQPAAIAATTPALGGRFGHSRAATRSLRPGPLPAELRPLTFRVTFDDTMVEPEVLQPDARGEPPAPDEVVPQR